MSDLISRQAVLELLQMKYFGKDLYKAIYELPSAENKGKWIRTRTWEHDGELYCSNCGFAPYDERDCDNFCPYCGAKMKEDEQMNRERAVELLEHVVKRGRVDDGDYGITDDSTLDALEMAISALKDSKSKGKWIDSSNGWTCSICNRDSKRDTDFCPDCGVDMRGE